MLGSRLESAAPLRENFSLLLNAQKVLELDELEFDFSLECNELGRLKVEHFGMWLARLGIGYCEPIKKGSCSIGWYLPSNLFWYISGFT